MEVSYVDHMGNDLRVVNAARVSFKKISHEFKENDKGLINYLAKHGHWTPFSHVIIQMVEKVPIFVARQRFKHFIGFTYATEEEDGLEASYNEVSRRYVDEAPEFFVPEVWRGKPVSAKQGSSDEVITELELDEHLVWDMPETDFITMPIDECYEQLISYAKDTYDLMIKNGVAPEQARMVLPQSMYTEYYCTGSLAAWARAYKLRSDAHAQKEIQDLAAMWNTIISGIKELEHSWKALTCAS